MVSPVVVHSNPGFLFADPPPSESVQTLRAAQLLYGMLSYKDLVDRKLIHVEATRENTSLCMAQYERIFSACRIPRRPEDELRIYKPEESKHVVVVCAGQFFSMDVYNPITRKHLGIAVSSK